MKRRSFIISTACVAAALSTPTLDAAPLTEGRLKAVFRKLANDISAKSFWEVFEGDRSLFKVTVDQIIRTNPELSYFEVGTYKFGKLILRSVRNKGVEKTKAILGFYGNLEGLADDDHIQYKYIVDDVNKYRRAKCLSDEFYRRGLIEESGIDKQTLEILKWNEEAFLQVKKIVEKLPKTA